ncbi:MAG: hypothetical protein KAS93_06590 [Gammaproteobacteria bacterium]|nr:hypothetical protein [Gammaproteobacteria bacterium]
MSIPGLGTLKTWGLIVASFGLTILFAFLKSEKAGRANDKLKGEIQARKTSQSVNKAMVEGKNREDAAVDKVRNSDGADRTGFE